MRASPAGGELHELKAPRSVAVARYAVARQAPRGLSGPLVRSSTPARLGTARPQPWAAQLGAQHLVGAPDLTQSRTVVAAYARMG